jgi:hypothetical protein
VLPPRAALPAAVSLAVAAVLAGTAAAGNTAFGVALLLAQAVVTLAWLALTEVDGAQGATVIVLAGALAADLLAVRREGADLAGAVSVVALAFVASLAFQLFRPHRQRVVEALAGTVSAVVLVVFAAHLLAASAKTGWAVAATGLLCAAAALVGGRAGDVLLVRPRLLPTARRGWLGLLLGLAAGAGLGALLGGLWAPLSAGSGALVGAAAAVAAAAADLGVDLVDADVARDRRRSDALRPLAILLPLVVAAPVAYAAARLLVG